MISQSDHRALENGLDGRVVFIQGDLLSPPAELIPGRFDHVMANPPYFAEGHGNPPPDLGKRTATVEGDAVLADWLGFLLAMTRDGGSVTVIHRYERLGEVVDGLAGEGAGHIVVFPFWPKQPGKDAKRVLVQAVKGKTGEPRLAPSEARISEGLVLHRQDGSYSEEAEAVLRDAGRLRL